MEPGRSSRPVMDVRPRSIPEPINRAAETAPAPPVSSPAEPQPPALPTERPAALPPKAKAPIFAIITAILVAGALIGLTVFAFLKYQDSPTPSPSPTTTEQADNEATPTDVDQTTEDIDQELNNLNDDQDFDSNAISDETLDL